MSYYAREYEMQRVIENCARQQLLIHKLNQKNKQLKHIRPKTFEQLKKLVLN